MATTPGNYAFTVQVTSGVGVTDTKALTLKVTALNIRDPFNMPDGFNGVPYSYTLSAINAAAATTFTLAPGSVLPAGLNLSSAGAITGTPSVSGFANFTVNVSDGTDTVSRGFNILIAPLRITTPRVLPNVNQNGPYSQSLAASGGTGAITWSQHGGMPNGLSLSSGGAISGNANTGPGVYYFNVVATDSTNASYSKQMAITVIGTTPALASIGNTTFDTATVGNPFTGSLFACCGGVAPFTWNVTGLPAGLSFRSGEGTVTSSSPAGGVEIWGIPQATGTFNLTVTSTGADGGTATQVFPLRVTALDLTPGPNGGVLGTPYNQGLRILGGSPPYTLSIPAGSSPLPTGISLVATPGSLTGTPTENGFFNPTISAVDSGSASLSRVVGIFIDNVAGSSGVQINNNGDLGTYTVGQTVNQNFFGNGSGALSWAIVAGPTPPGLNLSGSGSLTGTVTTAGVYNFQVRLTDSSAKTALKWFRLVVTPISITTAPTLPFGNQGTPYTLSPALAATGGTGALTWSLAPLNYLPPGLSLSTAGVISGTPTGTGLFYFMVNVVDGSGNTSNRQFNVSIYTAGGAPPITINTGANLGDYRLGTGQFELLASGGNGVYTWSLASGSALPPGYLIRTDVPAFFNPLAQAGILGVGTQAGTYTFTLNVASGTQTASRTFTLKLHALVPQENNVPDQFAGQPVNFQFTPLNASGTVSFALDPSTPLPGTLSLSSTGLITGTAPSSGVTPFRFTMTDTNGSVWYQYNLNVFALRFTSNSVLPNATQGAAYPAFTVSATGGTGAITYAMNGGLPSGLALNATTGVITGTVSASAGAGTYYFNVSATDSTPGTANSYSRNMSITVIGSPITLPRINIGLPDDVTLGDHYSWTLCPSNGGTAPFSWSVAGLPTGLSTRSGSAASSYVSAGCVEIFGVTQVPSATFNPTITMTDLTGVSTSVQFPLHLGVLAVNAISNGSVSMPNGSINTPYSYTIRVLGGTGGYSSSQPVAGKLPAGLTLNGSTLLVSGTPQENSTFSPILVYSDNTGNTYRRTTSIQITGGNNTIQVNGSGFNNYDLGAAAINQPYSISFSACCIPNALNWTLLSGSLPPGLTLATNGTLSGTPTTAGPYTFLLKATDSGNVNNAGVRQFKLTITNLSITTSSLNYGNATVAYSTGLASSGGTGAVTWALFPGNYLPPGLTLSTGGLISGVPTSTGNYSFTVVATDSAGTPNIAYRGYNLNIYPFGAYPPLTLTTGPNLSYGLGRAVTGLSASGGLAPYHYALAPGAPAVPGFRVQDGAPLPVDFQSGTTAGFIGLAATPGTYTTTIRVTDSQATPAVFDRNITVYILPMTTLDQFVLPKATINQAYRSGTGYQLTPTGAAGAWTFTATGGLPAGMTLSSTGLLSGTPTASGNFNINFSLANAAVTCPQGVTCTTFGTVQLVVDPFSITNNGLLTQGTQGTAYNGLTFAASTANCGSSCAWAVTSNSLPSGLSLNGSTGAVTGTPSASGYFPFTIRAQGSAGTVTKTFGLNIAPNTISGLAITTTITSSLFVGSGFSSLLTASGGTAPYTFSLASGTLPPGISLSDVSHTGPTLGGNLNPGGYYLYGKGTTAGTYTFTVQATDSSSTPLTATRAFTLVVSPLSLDYTGLPLSGNNCGTTTCQAMILNQTLSGTGQPMLVLGGTGVYSAFAPASVYPGLTMNAATGTITGAPANTGSQTTLVTGQDSNGSTFATFVSINPGSGASGPTVTLGGSPSFGQVVALGASSSYNISPSGGTGPYTISAVGTLPPGILILQGPSLPPSFNLNSYGVQVQLTTPGSVDFTLQAQDANGVIGTRSYRVIAAGNSGVITSNLPDAPVGVPYSQRLYSFAPGGVTFTLQTGQFMPPGLTLAANGSITGTPTAPGTYTVNYTYGDATTTVGGGFNLKVTGINITPASPLPIAIVGQSYNTTLTATGGAGTVTWTFSGLPNGLSACNTGGNTCAITGVPAPSSSRAFVTVTASDGTSSISKNYELYVKQQNPSQLDLTLSSVTMTDAVAGLVFVTPFQPSGGTPPYTAAVAPGSSLPPGAAILNPLPSNLAPGQFAIGGSVTTPGLYTFDIIITDAVGATITRTFTQRVTPLFLTTGNPRNATSNVAYSYQFQTGGGTAPYTYTIAPSSPSQFMLPSGLTLSSSGLLSGTTAYTGTYTFILTVTDSGGASLTRTLSLTVTNASNGVVTTSNAGATVGTPAFGTLNASGFNNGVTWSLAPGSGPLPTGGTLSGNQITGIFGTAGAFNFVVRATDNSNSANFADRLIRFEISPGQVVSPLINSGAIPVMPSARVGVPYSFTYKLAGGTPPYTFVEWTGNPLPPGLTLSSAGVLSGTPTQAGLFALRPMITDAAGLRLVVSSSSLAITGPTGRPNLFPTNGPIGGTASVGSLFSIPLDRLVAGVGPYTWSLASGTLPTGMSILPGTNGVSSYLAGIPTTAGSYSFTLNVTDSGSPAQSLTYPVQFDVSPLTLTPTTIPNGIVGNPYSVSFVASGGQTFSITQFGTSCSFAISPSSIDATPAGGSATINVIASDSSCTWPASSGLSVALPAVTTGSGQATITIPTNSNALAQVLTATIAGQTLTVNQSGAACTPSLGASGTSIAPGGGNGSVSITAAPGCPYSTIVGPAWISITSGGSGNIPAGGTANLTFSVAPNSTTVTRSGNILVGGQPFLITEDGLACSVTLDTSALPSPFATAGGNGSIGISANGPNCAWTAVSNSAFAAVSPPSGTGSSTVTVSLSSNAASATARTGSVSISGQNVGINQAGTTCTFALRALSSGIPSGGGVGSVGVIAPAACSWTAVSNDSFLSVASGASSNGTTEVLFVASPNSSASPRIGTLTIAGQTFTANQAGAPCSYTLGTSTATVGSPGVVGQTFAATAAVSGCNTNAISYSSWLTVTTSFTGVNGTVTYTAAANPSASTRIGNIQLGDKVFVVTQSGAACAYSLNSYGTAYNKFGGTGTILGSPNALGCTPVTGTTQPTIIQLSPLGGPNLNIFNQDYIVNPFNSVVKAVRRATITFGGQIFTVKQTSY